MKLLTSLTTSVWTLFNLLLLSVNSSSSGYIYQENAFLLGYANNQRLAFESLDEATSKCDQEPACTGVTREENGEITLRSSSSLFHSPVGEASWVKMTIALQQQSLQRQQQQQQAQGQNQQYGYQEQFQQQQQQQYRQQQQYGQQPAPQQQHSAGFSSLPSSYDAALSQLPNLAGLAGLAGLNKAAAPPVDKLALLRAQMNGFMEELVRCGGINSQMVSADGSVSGASIDNSIKQAVQYCGVNQCEAKTMAWLWHNLALRTMIPCGNFDPYAHNAHILPLKQASMVRSLFKLSLEEDKLDGAVWLKYANFENSQGEQQNCIDALVKGASSVIDKAQKMELFHTLGVHMHDHRMWEYSYQGFKAAIQVADQAPQDHTLSHLRFRSACQALYLGQYLADWDYVDALLPPTLKHLEESLRDPSAEMSELHPWVSICLPMPQGMRLSVASIFARRLRKHALTPLDSGGQGLIEPQMESHQTLRAGYCGGTNCSQPKRKLRVGFASADFKQKATAYLCLSQFRHFDRSRVEVYLYATTPDSETPSEWRQMLKSESDYFREIDQQSKGVSAREASQIVMGDKLDVLIDLDGYSNEGLRRSELFTVRHAPVTLSWFVYMSTVGNPHVDYIVGDSVVLPDKVSKYMSGKVINMPHSFFPNSQRELFPLHKPLFGVDPTLDMSRSQYGLPYRTSPTQEGGSQISDAAFVFASFNKHLKIKSELFATWASVLRRLPNSKLLLLRYPKDSEPRIRERAQQLGVESQLVFVDFVATSVENFIRLWRCVDAVLDTTIYGAHTGTVDALWAGLPVVTCVGHCVEKTKPADHGNQMASRVAASMLQSSGVPELIATDLEAYAELMFRMATNVEWYDNLRQKVEASRASSPMWDAKAYSDSFIDGLFQAWHLHIEGEQPEHIFAQDFIQP